MFWVLLETVWSLLHRLLNELTEAPCVLCQTAESYQQYSPGICFSARRAHPSFILFFSFIHHNFYTILFFSWKRNMFLITSGLFITNDTLHIALRRYSECWRKWGYASTLCSSVLMKREIEGRKAFIFWQNAMPGHEYLLLLSAYSLCEGSVEGSWSCLREHWEKVWSGAVNHLEEAFTLQVTWRRFIMPQKGSKPKEA